MKNILTILASSKGLEGDPSPPAPRTDFVNHKPVAIEPGDRGEESRIGKGLLGYPKS